jgi:hypothetical protein
MLRLQNVLSETERATRGIRELAAELKREPSTILRGRATP